MTNSYTHGHVIPLIGGSVLGATKALNRSPEWIASWGSVFGANDQYCLKYFSDTPYFELDESKYPSQYVDIVTCLPPCAGLSMGNTTSGDKVNNPRGCNAPSNLHMLNGSEFAMSKIKPKAMIVENAPALYSKMGEVFAERINDLAQRHGYTMSLVKTTSLNHGVPQERTRSFYFLWQGNKVPVLEPIKKPYTPFHKFLSERKFAPSEPVSNKPVPSSDPLWQFIEAKYKNCVLNHNPTKQDILANVASQRMTSTWNVIYDSGWLEEACKVVKDERMNRWLNYTLEKKRAGKNIMDGSMKLAWQRTQALMWKSLPMLMHPYEDRWLTVAEGLALMGFPDDYATKVHIPTKSSNVICQNVPACTAGDWVEEIVQALDGNRAWIDPELKPDGTYKILRQNNTASTGPMKPIWSL
jgi:site-specific DNA-cytosine methylase